MCIRDSTLTDAEVDKLMADVKRELENKHKARLRE